MERGPDAPVVGSDRHENHVERYPLVSKDDLDLLNMLGRGLLISTIATRLGCSPRTVRRRLRALCDKIEVGTPIEAAVWAARRGLI